MYCSLWFFQTRWALFSYFAPRMHHFIARLKQLECFLHRYLSWTHNADLLTVTLLVDGFSKSCEPIVLFAGCTPFSSSSWRSGFSPRSSALSPVLSTLSALFAWSKWSRTTHSARRNVDMTKVKDQTDKLNGEDGPSVLFAGIKNSSVFQRAPIVSWALQQNPGARMLAVWFKHWHLPPLPICFCVWMPPLPRNGSSRRFCRKRRLFEIRLQEHEALWPGVSERRRVSSPWSEFESWNRNMELLWALPVQKDEHEFLQLWQFFER